MKGQLWAYWRDKRRQGLQGRCYWRARPLWSLDRIIKSNGSGQESKNLCRGTCKISLWSPGPVGSFEGNCRGNKRKSQKWKKAWFYSVWDLGGCSSVQNAPTGSGNNFHTRGTQFWEFVCQLSQIWATWAFSCNLAEELSVVSSFLLGAYDSLPAFFLNHEAGLDAGKTEFLSSLKIITKKNYFQARSHYFSSGKFQLHMMPSSNYIWCQVLITYDAKL